MGKIIDDKSLKLKFNVFGYEKGNELIDIDESLINILSILHEIPYGIKDEVWFCTRKRLVRNSMYLLDSLFNLHDVKYISEEMSKHSHLMVEMGFVDCEKVLNNLNERYILKSPYELPIKYSSESMVNCTLFVNVLFFYAISIDKSNFKMVIPEYIHELVHTQLISQNGVVVNYHNREVLSIFMEKLSSLMFDSGGRLLYNMNLLRYMDLFKCIEYQNNYKDDERKLEACVYIVSSLKANKLFDMFVNGNNNIKKEIISGIQKVFDGNVSLEDFLERFDISFDNSKDSNILKRQLKI